MFQNILTGGLPDIAKLRPGVVFNRPIGDVGTTDRIAGHRVRVHPMFVVVVASQDGIP